MFDTAHAADQTMQAIPYSQVKGNMEMVTPAHTAIETDQPLVCCKRG